MCNVTTKLMYLSIYSSNVCLLVCVADQDNGVSKIPPNHLRDLIHTYAVRKDDKNNFNPSYTNFTSEKVIENSEKEKKYSYLVASECRHASFTPLVTKDDVMLGREIQTLYVLPQKTVSKVS